MPTIKGPIQGNRLQYLLRTGINTPEFHGINKQKDPAAIDENQFQSADNVRLRGGRMWARGGQSKFNGTAMTASCVLGIFDFNATAVNMLIAPKAGGTPLFYNSNYMQQPTDPLTFPLPAGDTSYTLTTTFPGLFPSGLTPTGSTLARRVFHKFRNQIIAYGSDGYLYKLLVDKEALKYPSYIDDTTTPGTVTLISEQLFNPEDIYAGAVPNTSCEWRETLWFASRDGHVYSWDGEIFLRDTTVTLNGGKADGVIFQLFEDIYCAVTGGLYKRDSGAWTSVTLPALTDFRPRAAAVWQNNAYIAGADLVTANHMDPVLLKLASPTTCTEVARDVSGGLVAAATYAGASEVQVSGDTLYIGYCERHDLGENIAIRADGFLAGAFTNATAMSEEYGSNSSPNIGFLRFAPVGQHVVAVPAKIINTIEYSVVRPGTPFLAVSGDDATAADPGEAPFWDAIVI